MSSDTVLTGLRVSVVPYHYHLHHLMLMHKLLFNEHLVSSAVTYMLVASYYMPFTLNLTSYLMHIHCFLIIRERNPQEI